MKTVAGLFLGGSVAACSMLTSLNGLTGGVGEGEDAARSSPDGASDAVVAPGFDGNDASAAPTSDDAGDAYAPSGMDAADSNESSLPSIARVQVIAPGWGFNETTTLTPRRERGRSSGRCRLLQRVNGDHHGR